MRTFGVTSGTSAKPAIVGPPSTKVVAPGASTERARARRPPLRRSPRCACRARWSRPRAGRIARRGSDRPPPDVLHGRVVDRVGEERDRARAAATTERTCRSAGVIASPSASRRRAPSRSPAVTQPAVGELGGHAGHQLDPRRRRRRASAPSFAGRRVGLEHLERALVARLHGEQQAVRAGPAHVGEVGEAVPVPLDLDVGRAGRRCRGARRAATPRRCRCPPPGRRPRSAAGRGGPGRRSTSAAPATCRRGRRRAASPSGLHQYPRWRPISSAAMNSAEPQLTSASGSPAIS